MLVQVCTVHCQLKQGLTCCDNCGDEMALLTQEWDSKSEKLGVLSASAAVTATNVDPGSIRAEGTQQEPPPDENKVK